MDEIEKKIKKCQYCGEEKKNPGAHERYCKANPANINAKPLEAEQAKPEEYKPLIITDVQNFKRDIDIEYDVAWFKDEIGNKSTRAPVFIGNVHYASGDIIPSVLLITPTGSLLPPSMMPGFMGMYPQFYEFPEIEQIDEQPKEPTKSIEETIKSEWSEDNSEQVITPPVIHTQEQKKQSFFASIFGRKEKKEKKEEISAETKDMLRQVANVGN